MRRDAASVVVQRYARRRLARHELQRVRRRRMQLVMCAQQTAWAARALLAPPVEVLAQARPPGFAMMAQAWVAEWAPTLWSWSPVA